MSHTGCMVSGTFSVSHSSRGQTVLKLMERGLCVDINWMQEELEEFLSERRKRETNLWGFKTEWVREQLFALCAFSTAPLPCERQGYPTEGQARSSLSPFSRRGPNPPKLRVPFQPLTQPFGRAGPSALPCVPPEPLPRFPWQLSANTVIVLG